MAAGAPKSDPAGMRSVEKTGDANARRTKSGKDPSRDPDSLLEASVVVSSLKKDQVVRGVKVSRLNEQGQGAVTVYVRRDRQLFEFAYDRVLPGERVNLRVGTMKRDRFKPGKDPGSYRLIIDERCSASPDEVTPPCEHFSMDKCGGCTLQHLAPQARLREKQDLLLARCRQFEITPSALQPAVPCPEDLGFHGRTEFSFFLRDGVRLGLHPAGNPVPVSINKCHLHSEAVHEAFSAVVEAVRAEPDAVPFSERTGVGWLCSAVFRTAPDAPLDRGSAEGGTSPSGRVLVTFITIPTAPRPMLDRIAARLTSTCPRVAGVLWSAEGGEPEARLPGWRSLGTQKQVLLAGSPSLPLAVAGRTFNAVPEAFLRPNVLLASALQDHVVKACSAVGPRVVYDLFCGQGLLSFQLLAQGVCERVVAVDRSVPALDSFWKNLQAHNLSGKAELIEVDLGNIAELRRLSCQIPLAGVEGVDAQSEHGANDGEGQLPRPDVVIVDTGRSGMPKPFRRVLYQIEAPVILCIGVGVSVLKDCSILQRNGYKLASLAPFDTYPHTPRLEIVARLVLDENRERGERKYHRRGDNEAEASGDEGDEDDWF